jgi:hypothetical protein
MLPFACDELDFVGRAVSMSRVLSIVDMMQVGDWHYLTAQVATRMAYKNRCEVATPDVTSRVDHVLLCT